MKIFMRLPVFLASLFLSGTVFGMDVVQHEEVGLRCYEQFFQLPQRLRAQLCMVDGDLLLFSHEAWGDRELKRKSAIALLLDMHKLAIILGGTNFSADLLTRNLVEEQRERCVNLFYSDKVGSPYATLRRRRKQGLLSDCEWTMFLDKLGVVAECIADPKLQARLTGQIASHRQLEAGVARVNFELPQREVSLALAPLAQIPTPDVVGHEEDDSSELLPACCFMCCLPCMLWYCRVSS